MRRITFVTVIILMIFINPVLGVSEKEMVNFFENYIKLSDHFDISVKNLYADDAKIHAYRRYPHGLERAMEMTGKDWKRLLEKFMATAQKKGDISEYKNIVYSKIGSNGKIKANRYSKLKCYTDTAYYMVVRKDDSGIKIIEEYVETQPQSNCVKQANGNLKQLLKNAENQIKGHLPVMVDEDTRLDSVKIDNKSFYYVFTLITVSPGEFDSQNLTEVLSPSVLNSSCNMKNIKSLINAGATISYTYKDKDGVEITTIEINKSDCE